MFQILDNGDRAGVTHFIIHPQPADWSIRPGFSATHNAGDSVRAALSQVAINIKLINEFYGTKDFQITIEA